MNKYNLLIDEDCPMCRVYGKYLANKKDVNLTSYQVEKKNANPHVDFETAKNRIALVASDGQNHTTYYGVDAMLIAFRNSFPRLVSLFKKEMPYRLMSYFYNFISLNRKVIAPARPRHDYMCIPDFDLNYRLAYIVLTALFTSFILNVYCGNIFEVMGLAPSMVRELIICFGQILWQSIVFRKWDREYKMEYLGNMMTVSMIGGLLLVPMILLRMVFEFSVWVELAYFFVVVNIMLLEHMRRCSILLLGWMPSISWVIYRVVVMIILFGLIKLM
jgi:hypothetical protein